MPKSKPSNPSSGKNPASPACSAEQGCSDIKKIKIIKIDISVDAPDNKCIMNDPAHKIIITAQVTYEESNSEDAIDSLPSSINFTFIDPGLSNTEKRNSYEYSTTNYLGKRNNPNSIFWEAHPDHRATSADTFKTKASAELKVSDGTAVSKIYFKPSGVGGDDYKIKATLYASDGTTVLKTNESKAFSIWRKVKLEAYEMTGYNHITTHGSEGKMTTKYYTNDTYVRYIRGTMTAITPTYRVKYIGLWNHTASAQRNWTTEQQKTTTETPTADEKTKANGPPGPDQIIARNAIHVKAEAWKNRILNNMMDGLRKWPTDASIPLNSIIALQYFHPKYDSQSPSSDSNTSEWSEYPWLTISYQGNSIHPDQRWNKAQAFAYNTRVFILDGMSAARYEVAIAHEIGHVTKDQFKRDQFGAGDHSATSGLMDTTGSRASFTNDEKKILRGVKP